MDQNLKRTQTKLYTSAASKPQLRIFSSNSKFVTYFNWKFQIVLRKGREGTGHSKYGWAILHPIEKV